MTFVRAGLGDALLAAVLLCFGCTSTDNATGSAGAAGQSAGHGGESATRGGRGGAEAASSGGASGDVASGDAAGADAAGADAGGSAGDENEAGTGSGGSGLAGTGGAPGAGSGGLMTAGSTATGGYSGSDECLWDPTAADDCPACSAHDGCTRPSYKYIGSGAITASCCGLEWQEETAPGEYTWTKANEYCESLALLGGGWRLPKIAELHSLLDLSDESHSSPTIDVDAFADTLREAYWSASLAGKSGQAAWSVDFSDGTSRTKAIDEPGRLRCVR